ncbi:MAG: hypothetical protein LBL46_03575 [Rickettsiales bacterium]|jgi:hypothetical protein|nr:hypothetical protein [Rickettsiales bacterium]
MKKIIAIFAALFVGLGAARAAVSSSGDGRGNQQTANTYRNNQRANYYMITQPDVDSACRDRIYKCLSDYCGDVLVVPGTASNSSCNYATESELYNWALMCLSRDRAALLPQYGTGAASTANAMNTAARLCPSYIQSELMSYLSMANLAETLTLKRSDECVSRRQELSAAISCHQVAITYGSSTQNRLVSELTNYCGDGLPGGSGAMVQKFATAGNLGANVLGWAEKIVSMDLSNKGPEWQSAMDGVLAYYTNRMNLACGDNMKITTPTRVVGDTSVAPTLTTIANLAMNAYSVEQLKQIQETGRADAPIETIWQEVRALYDIYDYATAKQVVDSALSNTPLMQNRFLSSSQMASVQDGYRSGVKVFVIRDSNRCWLVPVRQMSTQEQNAVAYGFANCAGK